MYPPVNTNLVSNDLHIIVLPARRSSWTTIQFTTPFIQRSHCSSSRQLKIFAKKTVPKCHCLFYVAILWCPGLSFFVLFCFYHTVTNLSRDIAVYWWPGIKYTSAIFLAPLFAATMRLILSSSKSETSESNHKQTTNLIFFLLGPRRTWSKISLSRQWRPKTNRFAIVLFMAPRSQGTDTTGLQKNPTSKSVLSMINCIIVPVHCVIRRERRRKYLTKANY